MQADGTSWMAMYCLNMMRISLELALHDHVYEDIATKFFEHFLHIAEAINGNGNEKTGLWSEADEFYYDVLQLPDGSAKKLELRSMVGLIPLFAVEVLEPEMLQKLPSFHSRLEWFLSNRPELAGLVSRWLEPMTSCRRSQRRQRRSAWPVYRRAEARRRSATKLPPEPRVRRWRW